MVWPMFWAILATAASVAIAFPATDTNDHHHLAPISNQVRNASSHWRLINEKHYLDRVWVRRYRSLRTNLTLTVAESSSPIVSGLFCLVTEDDTDDGTPHTLEHLIFQGSKRWPYKEILDMVAKKSLSGMTNAWTAQDHTCYWVENAGQDGFLNTLPVYLDHMFHPTLEDAAFVTEVHHIDEKGEDAGTVYSEMQAADESKWRKMYSAAEEALYPGDSSYESNTGGSVKNLRNSTTLEKIKKYHDKFYRPNNVEVIITGPIDIHKVFESLQEVEDSLVEEGRLGFTDDWEQPFSRDYEMPEEDVEKVVLIPGEHDERGPVMFAWRLPFKYRDNVERIKALGIIGEYLFSTPAAPFKKAFVDVDNPLASWTWSSVNSYVDPYMSISFQGVEVERMGQLEPLMNETLQKFYDEDMDMERIKINLQQRKERMLSGLESSSDFIQDPAIQNLVHGGDWGQHFFDDIDIFMDKDQQYWKDTVKESLDSHRILIKIRPCPATSTLEEHLEKKRIEERKEELGEEGLKEMKAKLDAAVESKVLPPEDVIEAFPAADATKVKFWDIESYNRTTCKVTPVEGIDVTEVPVRFQFDHLDSMFIRYSIVFDIKHITDLEDRLLLSFLTSVWDDSPIKVNETFTLETEDVIKKRKANTINFYSSLAFATLSFETKVAMDKFHEGLEINRLTMFNVQPSVKLLKSNMEYPIGEYASWKRDSYSLLGVLTSHMLASDDYPTRLSGSDFIAAHNVIKKLKEQLESEPDTILKRLEELRNKILTPQNAFVYLAGDKKLLSQKYGAEVTSAWKNLFSSAKDSSFPSEKELEARMQIDRAYWYRKQNPKVRQAIASINGTETCHFKNLIDLRHPERFFSDSDPDLELALEYINEELFKKVRGEGLAYGARVGFGGMGTLQFSLYRASNVVGGYKVFREILGNLTQTFCQANMSEAILESCFGSRTYDAVSAESSLDGLASQSKWSYLTDSPGGALFNRNLVKRLMDVTVFDVHKAIKKYFLDFMHPEKTFMVATCGPSHAKKVAKSLKEDWDFDEIVLVEDIEDSFVSGKEKKKSSKEDDHKNSTNST